jgi:hypothetical protein
VIAPKKLSKQFFTGFSLSFHSFFPLMLKNKLNGGGKADIIQKAQKANINQGFERSYYHKSSKS